MTLGRLLLRNLFFHWRGNLAVLLGVMVGTAVLTGALLVGDSLRGSLRDLTLDQLGWVDHSLVGGRFVREELAEELLAQRACPVILLQGAASATTGTAIVHRIGRVSILGVDQRFWPAGGGSRKSLGEKQGDKEFWRSREEVILNAALADELGVLPGDTITLYLQKVSALPRESVFGRREASEVTDELQLRVHSVIPNQGMGRFSLNPSPVTARNAFLPLAMLQSKLHRQGQKTDQEKRVNAILVGGIGLGFQEEFRRQLTLEDWGLKIYTPKLRVDKVFAQLDHNGDGKLTEAEWRRRFPESLIKAIHPGWSTKPRKHDGTITRDELLAYYEKYWPPFTLESGQMLLEPFVVAATEKVAREMGLAWAPTLVYLSNSITNEKQTIPYSIVAALNPALGPRLGPFLPSGINLLQENEIILVDWKDSPLKAKVDDAITLTYFAPEIEGRIQDQSTTFRLRGFIPLEGIANNPDLTPEFPGITDKLVLAGRDGWNPPFPFDNTRVKRVDEQYWEEYRTTPKAYITLKKGQELWGSRFGEVTSVRFDYQTGSYTDTERKLSQRLPQLLEPAEGGLVFADVRAQNLEKSSGASDFDGLFLGFSCFLIVAALLLVGLLVRLNLDRRASELGLLLATGFRRSTVRGLLLAEAGLLALIGGLIGLGGALLYAWLLLDFLRQRWPGGLDQSFLRLHATENFGLSYIIGYFASLIVSMLTIAWAVRILGRVAPRALLAGETATVTYVSDQQRQPRWSLRLSAAAALGGIAFVILGLFVRDHEMQSSSFFGSGALLLMAGLMLLWAWMRSTRHARVGGHGLPAVARLGFRNAGRHAVRSLLTAGLLASATFVIIAVQSFYRDPGRDFLELHAGSGGFSLIGESDVPLFEDLNNPTVQDDWNLSKEARTDLADVAFYPLRLHAGDDASCLNLYQPRQPRLLGLPHKLIERGGFQFKAMDTGSSSNPWQLLEQGQEDAIPVFGEANTVEWILHKSLGQTLEITDDRGGKHNVRFVGLLEDSIFQSELLMSEANFLKLFPRQEGYAVFLIQVPPDHRDVVRTLLETVLADHGFSVTPSIERLEAFLAVENTYLSTFQALGGLGLLLGALGLAVVLMRSIWERRGELALLRALGFRNTSLGWLVLAENGFLLIVGLAIGTLAALVSVAPHLFGAAGNVPWAELAGLLGLVLIVGLTAGAVAVALTLRAPLLPALRRE